MTLDELTTWILNHPSYTEAEMQDKIQDYISQIIPEKYEIHKTDSDFARGFSAGWNEAAELILKRLKGGGDD